MATQKASLDPSPSTNMARKFHIRSHTTIPTKSGISNTKHVGNISEKTATFGLGFRREQTIYSTVRRHLSTSGSHARSHFINPHLKPTSSSLRPNVLSWHRGKPIGIAL
ncbi:hypothetical protein ElyMa_007065600 [Elysia marginata]|uniref:Uncharacterized protein n=1 Tax=Elysia marginata TaxID=1093978 RepID=A0AAV4JVK8_9GAST|nr:hypothetical protein ElyMa_007065600 [Elysia marginata]